MRATTVLVLLVLIGCAGARSTTDPRVRSFRGQVPPSLAEDGVWIGVDAPVTSLADLRGRVVYLQFAFPT